MVETVFILNILSGFAMLGVILLVQVVHYPSFPYISEKNFRVFHVFHSVEITKIVLPLMLIELFTAFYFSIAHWSYLWTLNLLVVIGLWGITFLWSVPSHSKLEKGFNENAFQALMRSNCLRTCLWGIRAFILSYILWERLQ